MHVVGLAQPGAGVKMLRVIHARYMASINGKNTCIPTSPVDLSSIVRFKSDKLSKALPPVCSKAE